MERKLYLADEKIRPVAKKPFNQKMNILEPDVIDQKSAVLKMPALIKSYINTSNNYEFNDYLDS